MGLDTSLWLVLEDLHVIADEGVHAWLRAVIEHLPPNLHVLLTTRHDPPFPARWKARGWLTELRASDLRFSTREAWAFLNDRLELGLNADLVAHLLRRCEGWVAGLHLAGLALQAAPDRAAFVRDFNGSQRDIVDYLRDEVLLSQPEGLRRFLVQTSVLERLNAPLCQALTGRPDCAAVLMRLAKDNVFVTELDDGWFGYHDLFVEMLRLSLDPDKRRTSSASSSSL